MNAIKFFPLVAVVFVYLIGATVEAQTSYHITVKSGELRQTFAGFGTSQLNNTWNYYDTAPRNQMADMIYRDLKMNVIRLWVTTGPSITVANMLSEFNTSYVASGAIADVKSRGVTTLLLAPGAGGGQPAPTSISTYADNLAELILEIKTTYGINIDVTGIANEPEPTWTTANIVECVKDLRASLDSRGLTGVKIIAPESCGPNIAIPALTALYKDVTAWAGLYGVASHSYGGVLLDDQNELAKHGKPWWTTEASDEGNEVGEDENRASSILSRFLCEANHGSNEWLFFVGLGEVYDLPTSGNSTAYLVVYDSKTSTVVPFLKYYYFKQALNTIDVGGIFRRCVSSSEGDMFIVDTGIYQEPALNAAAAYNPDGSWGINLVNETGVTGSPADSSNLFYPSTSYNVTVTIEELSTVPNTLFTIYRSSANNHFVTSGTVNLVNGVGTVTVGPRELVSLRSGATAISIPPAPTGLVATNINAPLLLRWNNTMKATSWHVKRALVSGGPYTTIATTTDTNYSDTTASRGTLYYYVTSAVNTAGESANSSEVVSTPTSFPWTNADIGSVGTAGSFSVTDNGVFTLNGAGGNVGSTADAFNTTYKTMTGDGTFIARLAKVNYTNAQAGIMMSETLGTAPKAAGLIYNFSGSYMKAMMYLRSTAGSYGSWTFSTVTALPTWLKLTRAGNTFTGYASADGVAWSLVSSGTIPMADTIYIGMIDASGNPAETCAANFDQVSVTCDAPTELTQSATSGQINVGWSAVYGATSYNVKRATVSGGPYTTLATVSSPAISYNDTTVASGTDYYYVVSAVNSLGESPNSSEMTGWQNSDVGATGTGHATTSSSGSLSIQGSGNSVEGMSDSFNLTYRVMTGDGTLIARLASATNQVNSQAGIVMRETLGTSPKSACLIYDFNGAWLQVMMGARTIDGSYSAWSGSSFTTVPVYLKLVRAGNTFSGYASADGLTWTLISSSTISMGSSIYVGMLDCSSSCVPTFDSITSP